MLSAFWISNAIASLIILFFVFICIYMSLPIFYSLVQTLAPVKNRSLSTAFFLLGMNFVGAGLGPFITGGVSDVLHQYFNEANSLQFALSSLAVVIAVAASVLFYRSKHVANDLKIV